MFKERKILLKTPNQGHMTPLNNLKIFTIKILGENKSRSSKKKSKKEGETSFRTFSGLFWSIWALDNFWMSITIISKKTWANNNSFKDWNKRQKD